MRRLIAVMTVAIMAGALVPTLAASAKAIEAETLRGFDQSLPTADIKAGVIDNARSKPIQSKKIQESEVCFTVHNIGDPRPYDVSGTLLHQKHYSGGGTALLLQHGSVSERSIWDPEIPGVVSTADELAKAGYVVFTVDRLGYGRSDYPPYPGSGWALTTDSYIEMTHEMVTQIREGTYRVTGDTCSGGAGEAPTGRPVEKVVLVGHSGGAGITEHYATIYHDIDGIVPMGISSHWLADGDDPVSTKDGGKWGNYFINEVWLGQLAQGKDYVHLFSVGPDGYSQPCEDFLFYLDGVSEGVVEHVCGPGYFGGQAPRLMPSGDIATAWPYMQERIKLTIGNVGPTPALLVFADQDAIMTGPKFVARCRDENGPSCGEADIVTPEIKMWKERCNCPVEVLWQRNAGHYPMVHDSAKEMIAGVVEWLRSRGL